MEKTNVLMGTNFRFPDQTNFYRGKVRDVYFFGDNTMAMISSDRISAFDVVLPEGIPYKGQILNQIAVRFLEATEDIIPNWKIDSPDPNVTYGHYCEPFKVEMVIRGYLTGHAWREYKEGKRKLCGVVLPEGMVENQKFPEPIITPTTKALIGHDEDISREEIISRGLVSEKDYDQLEEYTRKIFSRGTEMAAKVGLILVDTKYEFGKKDGQIYLIDEVHTPDSSRYFYTEGYEECLANGINPKQLSKEFVRQWLIENGFQGKEGQIIPKMTKALIESFADRYIELYEAVMGEPFLKKSTKNISQRVKRNMDYFLV
jgi:phosphoribosylaminoimidazole-succinocarboxamide synthase